MNDAVTLADMVENLKEALRFYASGQSHSLDSDRDVFGAGKRARAALDNAARAERFVREEEGTYGRLRSVRA